VEEKIGMWVCCSTGLMETGVAYARLLGIISVLMLLARSWDSRK